MATDNNKNRLARDPNTPFDDQQIVQRRMPYYRGAGQDRRRIIQTRPDLAPQYSLPEAPAPAPAPPAQPRDPLTPEQRAEAVEFGTRAGRGAMGFLGERRRLAPGVRRYGGSQGDPSDIYMAVDANGNRVYTDDADFAAARSRGRLTRRDLAPGMTADDANRTLNDPEGGFTYAPTSPEALEDLREASKFTRGGSKVIERALAEAERSQDIADTRAGTRPIDKQREKQGRELRRRLGLDDGQGNMSIRDLIALQANDRAEREFAHKVDIDRNTASREDAKEKRVTASDMAGLLAQVRAGEIDPREVRDIIATLPAKQAERATASLQTNLLRRYLDRQNFWFGLGPGEIDLAQTTSIRRNPDGSGTYVEPDSGLFDIGRQPELSPEIMAEIFGVPEDMDEARERDLPIRLRRGF